MIEIATMICNESVSCSTHSQIPAEAMHPLQPCVNRFSSTLGVQSDPGRSSGWREQKVWQQETLVR
jgi:hypothetical protein